MGALLMFAGYMAYTDVCESIEADKAKKAERDRRHQESLKSLDEIGRSMDSMAETTKQLLDKEIERLEARNNQLRKKLEILDELKAATSKPEGESK
jgi:hypothetical protein